MFPPEWVLSVADLDLAAYILARLCYHMNQDLDQPEAEEIIRDFFEENNLDSRNVERLGALVRSAIYDPMKVKVFQ